MGGALRGEHGPRSRGGAGPSGRFLGGKAGDWLGPAGEGPGGAGLGGGGRCTGVSRWGERVPCGVMGGARICGVR